MPIKYTLNEDDIPLSGPEQLLPAVFGAAIPGGDRWLMRRGTLVKRLAQRVGFARTYWSRSETARWRDIQAAPAESAP